MQGQLITFVVILAFVALFLLREWVVQNTPPDLPVNDVGEEAPAGAAPIPPLAQLDRPRLFQDLSSDESESDEDNEEEAQNRAVRNAQRNAASAEGVNGRANAVNIGWQAPELNAAADRAQPPVEVNAARLALQARQMQAIQQGNDNNDDEFEFENAVDDLDGVLEAVGLRGNIVVLLQHTALMVVLIAGCLGSAVWTPYIVGKAFILIFPTVFVQLPIQLLRLFIDPIVDIALDVVLPFVLETFKSQSSHLQHLAETSPVVKSIIDGFQSLTWHSGGASNNADNGYQVWSVTGDKSFHDIAHLSWSQNATFVMPYWEKLVNTDYEQLLIAMRSQWYRFALEDSTTDRMACILIGYGVLVTIGSWYLARSRNAYGRTVGRALQQALRQQGAILKITFFIGIELMLFPLGCGMLLDFATLPLFPGSTVATRFAFWQSNPGIWTFFHWLLGTMFMFHFAVFVTLCREVVRPGVMWFIRNPNDPQFHPIKEILERPVMFQLRKIGVSALLYASLILFGIGTVVAAISHFGGTILPLRMSMENSSFSYHIDLIAAHVVIPTTMTRLKVKARFKTLLQAWWKVVSKHLRLSSFMFDGRFAEEEGTHVRKTWKAFLLRRKAPIPDISDGEVSINSFSADGEVEFVKNGHLVRAPKHDGVPVVRGRRMLVPVDPETYAAIDETDRRLGHPASAGPGGEELNTVVVYVPPKFGRRVIYFLYLMWVSGAVLLCSATILPLIMGRYLFTFYLAKDHAMHDLYSYLLGLHVLLALSFTADFVVRKINAWQAHHFSMSWPGVYHTVMHALARVANTTYVMLAFGLVMPMLVGLFVELYFVLPLRRSTRQDITTNLLQDWSVGIVYMNLTYGFLSWLPENYWRRSLRQIFANGILEAEARQATKLFLGPVILGGLLAIIIPALVAWAAIQIFAAPDNATVQNLIVRLAYPVACGLVILYRTASLSIVAIKAWVQSVRDEAYLVGRQLHNLPPPQRDTDSQDPL
ncbi:hypothetical protein INT43_005874, partial [Umbelopsis isabellina]